MSAVSVALATTGLLSLLMLVLLGSLLRSGVPGIGEWFAANAALTAALPLLLARNRIPDSVSIVVANVLVALAGATLYAGFARFLKRSVHWPWLLACTAATGLAMSYWRYVVDSIPMRVMISATFTAAVCMAIAVVAVRHHRVSHASYPYLATAILATIFAVSSAARGLYFSTLQETSSPLMFDTTANIILLCVGAATMPVLSMCAILMVHDSLLMEARNTANHDFLTGALSRKGFEAVTRMRFARADEDNLPLSFLIVDLDHFKAINDTFGHAGGDTVLRAFVEAMRRNLHPDDVLGRLGGEEFAILLPRATLGDAQAIADRLRVEASTHPVMTEAGPCRYSISGGLAFRLQGESLDQLSMRADRALYQAKVSGRNKVCVSDSVMTDEEHSAGDRDDVQQRQCPIILNAWAHARALRRIARTARHN
jgi:diguanylate cyclase (GGDEF)-like protein